MKYVSHTSANPSHYNIESEHYDELNEESSRLINTTVEKILRKYKVKTVLDLTCGTGSQVFWLAKRGYDVIGSDINTKMLKIARDKAKKEKLAIKFLEGDMRTIHVGKFDAVITIFNAVGHLTKEDFEKAMRTIHENLNDGGLYVFDIFDLTYLLHEDNITKLTIDWQKTVDDAKIRKIQYSTINNDGVLASYTTSYEQEDSHKPEIFRSEQTLQVYSAEQLRAMLHSNGFEILDQCGIDGSQFDELSTERIVTVARKQ
jgi:2-polyprenyl-3-methyl-5-hydroxy-6-metoxy-1,4-benzoquinol methylase